MIKTHVKDRLFCNPDVTSVGEGFRYRDEKRTAEVCLVVGVKKKLKLEDVHKYRLVPSSIEGLNTDVQDRDIKALKIVDGGESQGYTRRRRPCPPGYSIGHINITAGTLGAYVHTTDIDDYVILSNNHVLADSNRGRINDRIIQPGRADGGSSPSDLFAKLHSFAIIKWDGENGNGGGGCNIFKRIKARWYKTRMIEQPYPNLIDAAIAIPDQTDFVDLEYPDGSFLAGKTTFELGDAVKKLGRTTERKVGTVVGINTRVKVQYGNDEVATFDDQMDIRADEGNFSAGGDSGSAILTLDNYIGGLLFAGGSGVTIANRIKHVVDILGVVL